MSAIPEEKEKVKELLGEKLEELQEECPDGWELLLIGFHSVQVGTTKRINEFAGKFTTELPETAQVCTHVGEQLERVVKGDLDLEADQDE